MLVTSECASSQACRLLLAKFTPMNVVTDYCVSQRTDLRIGLFQTGDLSAATKQLVYYGWENVQQDELCYEESSCLVRFRLCLRCLEYYKSNIWKFSTFSIDYDWTCCSEESLLSSKLGQEKMEVNDLVETQSEDV